jgi:hypothetical protein
MTYLELSMLLTKYRDESQQCRDARGGANCIVLCEYSVGRLLALELLLRNLTLQYGDRGPKV